MVLLVDVPEKVDLVATSVWRKKRQLRCSLRVSRTGLTVDVEEVIERDEPEEHANGRRPAESVDRRLAAVPFEDELAAVASDHKREEANL